MFFACLIQELLVTLMESEDNFSNLVFVIIVVSLLYLAQTLFHLRYIAVNNLGVHCIAQKLQMSFGPRLAVLQDGESAAKTGIVNEADCVTRG